MRKKPRLVHTVVLADVGKNYFVAPNIPIGRELARGAINRHVSVVDCCGYFQAVDVGKRIYQVWNDAGDDWYLAIENDEQKKRRKEKYEDAMLIKTNPDVDWGRRE